MEKLDTSKYPESKGDFIFLPEWYGIDGWKNIATKKGEVRGLVLVRTFADGGKGYITLFADQLRQEGGKLLVSEGHYRKQLERAAKWDSRFSEGAAPKA